MTPTRTPTKTPSGPGYALFPAGVLLAQTGGDDSNLCNQWVYTLVVEQDYPSRMAVVKNVLGASVNVITPWQAPPQWPAVTNPNWQTNGAAVYGPELQDLSPVETGAQHWQHRYSWTVTFNQLVADPGPPFDLYTNATPPVHLQNSVAADGTIDTTQVFPFRDDTVLDPAHFDGLAMVVYDTQTSVQVPLVGSNTSDAIPQPALDVVGKNKDLVNWGLEIFSTKIDYVPCTPLVGGCGNPSGNTNVQVGIVAPIDTSDKGDVSSIETAMGLAASGGQNVFGSTPTKRALDFATTLLMDTAVGTPSGYPLTDDIYGSPNCAGDANCLAAHSFALPVDPKLDCNRSYATILVTDGLSNFDNPGGCNTGTSGYTWGNWIDPCHTGTDANGCSCNNNDTFGPYNGGPGCPDGGDPTVGAIGHSYVCPGGAEDGYSYQTFVAGAAENAWFAQVVDPLTLLQKSLSIRTWVIGVSKDVGPCELNATAYHGRTDASYTNGGFSTDADPFLPHSADVPPFDTNYDGPRGGQCAGFTHDAGHLLNGTKDGNYAFFAGSATQLKQALENVLGAYGAGNYTTSAPSIANTTTLTNIGFITTAEYPNWLGHVYAYDLTSPIICNSDADCPTSSNGVGRCDTIAGTPNYQKCKAPDTFRLLWDAGEVVSAFSSTGQAKSVNNGLPRKIYSWDPTNLGDPDPTHVLVPVEPGNANRLNSICGSCGVTSNVVDFIRGNDGYGSPRLWALGSIVNSTPGIIGPPQTWKQFSVHPAFETEYINRQTVAWFGSSDGALHAIDVNDGAELVSLVPPDKLDLEVQLYQNFRKGVDDPEHNLPMPMGEPTLPHDHVYGVANSPRFADIYDSGLGTYRTVLFITEGPGGSGLHALDVTHPTGPRTYGNGLPDYGGDPNFADGANGSCTSDTIPSDPVAAESTCSPVLPLWSVTKDGKAGTATLSDLNNTWSVPGVGGEAGGTSWELLLGNGYLNYDGTGATSNPQPHYLRLDPLTGAVRGNNTVTDFATDQPMGGPWLRNQAFADSSVWSTVAGYFQPDNDVNQGVQLDLQGHVWLMDRPSFASQNWSAPTAMQDSDSIVAGDPLYYAAAIAEFPSLTPVYDLYAFSSGTFYEKSAFIMGANVGIDSTTDTPNFIPGLFLASRTIEASPQTVIRKINIRDIPVTETVTNPDGTTSTITHNLGHRTQATAPPTIFVPNPGTQGSVAAIFLLFDPDASCAGRSYVVMVTFNPSMLSVTGVQWSLRVAYAGEGAASGMAIAGTMPVVAKSFAGTGGKGYFYLVEGLPISGAGGTGAPISWWAELQ